MPGEQAAAGYPGVSGSCPNLAGLGGGAAGYAINGINNVTFTSGSTGTVLGPQN